MTGPNGAGKSSLFRLIGELWPLHNGRLVKPRKEDILFVPQKPYLVLGTLRDQIIYPHSVADMQSLGITDDDLDHLLAVCLCVCACTLPHATLRPNTIHSLERDVCWVLVSHRRRTITLMRAVSHFISNDVLRQVVDPARTITTQWRWDETKDWFVAFSGGQKQRVAMARLFYHKPKYVQYTHSPTVSSSKH